MSLAGVSTIVCNSKESAFAVRSRVGNRKSVVYIPNSVKPIDDGRLSRAKWRQRLEISQGEFLVLGVGRLTPQKNFARFISMVALVNHSVPIRAIVAGRDDGLLESLQHQVNEYGLKPGLIQFMGAVPDARELMFAADVFVLSSDFEGMPNVVMEAMSAGIPTVCTRVNGVGALIDNGVDGFITDFRAEALTEKVLLLVRDKNLRVTVGASAAKRMRESFTPKMIAARLWQMCE